MIRQAAFEKRGKLLKGELHCHTTRSDGQGDPAEVIRKYAENEFDFLALTDHRYYNYENYAPETGVLIVPGMEMDRNLPGPAVHCHHIVCIGPEQGKGNGFAQDQRFDSASIETAAQCQEMLDWIHEAGNLTVYCHPQWSGVSAREFEELEGNFAMEIWNSGCAIEDGLDTDAAYWDELLVQGKRIFGVATDDGHAMYQHCNGWIRVNAEKDVDSILEALKAGAFYASCGPEIYDFRIEEGKAIVECSPVKRIQFRHFRVPYRMTTAPEGETVTEGSVSVRMDTGYIRAEVEDAQGRRAWTNPIFLGE